MIINGKMIPKIKEKLGTFHSLFRGCRLKAEWWEEVLFQTFQECGYENVEWRPHTHGRGKDIDVNDIRISCKGGQIVNKRFKDGIKKCLSLSSHRTTSQKTLEEKLDVISEKLVDIYFCLANPNPKDKDNLKYKLYIFDAKILNFRGLEWEEKKGGWKATGKFLARIEKSMSHQLWFDIPIELLSEGIDMGDY